MKKSNKMIFVVLAVMCIILGSCDNPNGGNESNNPNNNQNQELPSVNGTVTGYFIDAPVAGLAYETSSGVKGVTDADGKYAYNPGDKVTFLIGDAQLGKEVEASPVVTPCTLTGAESITAETVEGEEALNMVKMFMALDTDSSDFGLTLDKDVSTESLTTETLSNMLKSENFSEEITTVLDDKTIPTNSEATAHYNRVAGQIDGEENLDNHNSLVSKLQYFMKLNPNHSLFFACRLPEGINVIQTDYDNEDNEKSFKCNNAHVNGAVEYVEGFLPFEEEVADCPSCSYLKYPSCKCLQNGNYRVTMTALHSKSEITVGDVICYYDGFSFQQTEPENYPFVVDNSTKNIIYVDFTSDKHNAIVKEVYKITGTISVNYDTEKLENAGVASGKKLIDFPFKFFISGENGRSIALDLIYTDKVYDKENNITTYTYETSVLPSVVSIQASYYPFSDYSIQANGFIYDLSLTGDTEELNFSITKDNWDEIYNSYVPTNPDDDDSTEEPDIDTTDWQEVTDFSEIYGIWKNYDPYFDKVISEELPCENTIEILEDRVKMSRNIDYTSYVENKVLEEEKSEVEIWETLQTEVFFNYTTEKPYLMYTSQSGLLTEFSFYANSEKTSLYMAPASEMVFTKQ